MIPDITAHVRAHLAALDVADANTDADARAEAILDARADYIEACRAVVGRGWQLPLTRAELLAYLAQHGS